MISIIGIAGGTRVYAASGDAVHGIRYDGKICTQDYVFQELEQQGIMPHAVLTQTREVLRAGRGQGWSSRVRLRG
jgi:hypothetical protein